MLRSLLLVAAAIGIAADSLTTYKYVSVSYVGGDASFIHFVAARRHHLPAPFSAAGLAPRHASGMGVGLQG